jgi:MFS family permease
LLLSTGAFAAVSTLPDDAFFSWGWRIPFLASFLLLVVGMYIRLAVTEPDAFKKVQEEGKVAKLPIREVLANDKRRTLNLVFLQSAANVGYFLITVYSLVYVTETLKLPRTWAVTGLLLGAAVDLCLQPVFGWLSDRFGRKKVYGAGSLFLGLYAFPFFWLLESATEPLVWLALILGLGIGHASTGSLHAVIYAEQYPARYRYTGSSLAYQLSGIISSAPTPLVAAWLVSTTGQSKFVAVYVIIAAAVSVTCTFMLKETYKSRIDV